MYPASARSTTSGAASNLGGNQTRSSTNQSGMPSSSIQQGLSKGSKSTSNADPLRQLNLNQQQQQSTRPFSQQSAQVEGQDYSQNNNQRRGRQQQQQDYYNDFNSNQNPNNRRGNQKYGYSAWDNNNYRQQQSQRYPRQQQQQQQNYEGNRFYPTRRKYFLTELNRYNFFSCIKVRITIIILINKQMVIMDIVNDVIQQVV